MDNVTIRGLVEAAAEQTGLKKRQVREVLDSVLEKTAETLAQGGRVEVRGFASFSVGERKPRVMRNPRTGKPIMVPMTRRVKVRIAQALKKRVAEQSLSTGAGILIAGSIDPWAGAIRDGLAGIGYQLFTGLTIDDALQGSRFKPQDMAFVMVGPSMDDATYDAIARRFKLSAATSMLAVILGREDPDDLLRSKEVLILPDGTFSSAQEAVGLVHSEAERWREEKHYFGRQVTVRGPSDADSVEALKKTLEDFYKDALPDETETYKTLSALGEAIDNAAHYGNSDSSELHVTVTIMLNDERIAIDVKDEGAGFDFERVAAASAADAGAGLGMKMMRECTDEVRFSEDGTRVTLVKHRAAQPGAPV
ncbi:MAG: HU family DNA-binding protein [Planctomycetota bacterium]|jgi:DNA-binding protein HU-beta